MKIKNGYILRNIADEWIIVPIGDKIHDFNGLMVVNETGACLWKILQNDCSKEDLISGMMSEYEVNEETAKEDVDAFIESLIQGGVLEV